MKEIATKLCNDYAFEIYEAWSLGYRDVITIKEFWEDDRILNLFSRDLKGVTVTTPFNKIVFTNNSHIEGRKKDGSNYYFEVKITKLNNG